MEIFPEKNFYFIFDFVFLYISTLINIYFLFILYIINIIIVLKNNKNKLLKPNLNNIRKVKN